MIFWAFLVVIGAIYFGNMFFGQYSLDTLLSLENTKEELNKRLFCSKNKMLKHKRLF